MSRRTNGVDTVALVATLDAVRAQPELAAFRFRARTEWVSGAFSRTTINGFRGAGAEHHRGRDFVLDADHPAVLVGDDRGATPAEHLLHALGGCLVSGLVNIAAVRGIDLASVSVELDGDLDLLGLFGIADDVRTGFEQIRVTVRVSGDAEADQLAALVEQSQRRSVVHDVLTRGIPVEIRALVD